MPELSNVTQRSGTASERARAEGRAVGGGGGAGASEGEKADDGGRDGGIKGLLARLHLLRTVSLNYQWV